MLPLVTANIPIESPASHNVPEALHAGVLIVVLNVAAISSLFSTVRSNPFSSQEDKPVIKINTRVNAKAQ